jgi:hypothetical protein
MHGGGTVSGLQLVALIASKISCAFAADLQRNHHHGHQGHHQMRSSHQIQVQGQPLRGGSRGSGKGSGGSSGPGV